MRFLIPLLFCFITSTVFAAPPEIGGCGPLLDGAIINTAPECLNDSTFLTVDYSKADDSGWQYSFDSVLDGVYGNAVGGTAFEYYGLAIRETATDVWLVVNSNLPLGGIAVGGAQDGNVGHGDLFINLGLNDFATASLAHELFAVRYSDLNDSGAAATGIYGEVSAKSITGQNSGFGSLGSFINHVNSHGGVVGFGGLPANQTYYASGISLNVIDQGNLLDSIVPVTDLELAAAGFETANFAGTSTVGFRFARNTVIDDCGVVGGDGTSCLDCAGLPCGQTVVDPCGICGGDGTSCLDCSGVANGDLKVDQCGVCGGDGSSCLDCAGTVNGILKVDDCGVCGGDNTSCISCESTNISKVLLALDGSATEQRHLVKEAVKLLNKKNGSKTLAKMALIEADLNYDRAWNVAWSFPWTMKTCSANPVCVTIDNTPGKDSFTEHVEAQAELITKLLRKLKRLGYKTRRLSKLKRANRDLLTASIDALEGVPNTRSECLSPRPQQHP